ncbi:hypothetical protein E1832_07360 [Antarcticimicrobium luteum]|uniref:Uncharacterized protein n=2 Tax=Antarcticimicrobium luteum TaxID=2547397 RepID=A0A4R5VEQ2_9RHOB|nr:hypothetical protein E1832_07360 [Antarcticimicrobium luteum]
MLLMGGVGFAMGRYLLESGGPALADDAVAGVERETLYKMPLGKFTFQVLQPTRILHILIDMDVFLDDVTVFEQVNGTVGRARLRDATISAASDMAESMLWVGKGEEQALDTAAMAGRLVLKLHSGFPAVRSAQINQFMASSKPRD